MVRLLRSSLLLSLLGFVVACSTCPSDPVSTAAVATEPTPSEPVDLQPYERQVFSQFGEDGVIEKIFQIIEPTRNYAVEFGAWDGIKASNVRNLILNHGWSSFQIEGSEGLARRLAKNYRNVPGTKTLHAWVWPGNVEILFEEAGVPKDLDFLVIDIDSNDYYVWRAIHDFRPKVVMVEVNLGFPPPQLMVIDFHPMNYWDGHDYSGASLQSYYELAKRKGYELIYQMSDGGNVFFVDAPYYPRFGIRDNSPEKLFRPGKKWAEMFDTSPQGRNGIPFNEDNRYLTWKELKIEKKFIFTR